MIKLILTVIFSISFVEAATIESAQYDQAAQALNLVVSYEGGLKDHHFSLNWDRCESVSGSGQFEIAARLIDTGWDDTGVQIFYQFLSFDLSTNSCKPATLTVFSDRYSRATLWIE